MRNVATVLALTVLALWAVHTTPLHGANAADAGPGSATAPMRKTPGGRR